MTEIDKTEVVVCTRCKGAGRVIWDIRCKWVDGKSVKPVEACGRCEGTGLLSIRTLVTYTSLDLKTAQPTLCHAKGL